MGNSNAKATDRDSNDRPSRQSNAADGRATLSGWSGSIMTVTLAIGIAIVSGAIGAVLVGNRIPPPPRILVLDMAGLLDPIANDPALSANEKRRLTEELGAALNRSLEIEADKGAIILDASLVLKAPGESYVQPR